MKMLENVNLNSIQEKIESDDSERIINPAITTNLAIEKLKSINCQYDVEYFNIDNVFYSSELHYKNIYDLNLQIQPAGPLNGGYSSMGKGTTPEQCTASMYMETIERISLWQHMNDYFPVYKGLNLRTGETEKVAVDTSNSERVASGNTYEEAILHALHEMIENEAIGKAGISDSNGGNLTADLKPYKIVDFSKMYDWPDWVESSFVVLQIPTMVPQFYSFIGIRYPIKPNYAHDWSFQIGNDDVWSKKPIKYSEWRGNKTAYVFSSAGINPKKAISRCIQENFQGPDRYKYSGNKNPTPEWIEVIDGNDLVNHETNSISGDIKFIIDNIPEKFNVWAVDFTSPELGVPVVKIVTDYHTPYNLGHKQFADLFFNIEDS